jgi:hypothetical protein
VVNELKAKFAPGVNVYSMGTFTLDDWRTNANTIPAGFDYIMYNYEPTYVPEFTPDQTISNSYFGEIFHDVHQYNKRTNGHAKFIISFGFEPVGGYNWDFGQVQARSDALDVQLFGSQQNLGTISGYINHISSTDSNFIVQLGINADKNQTVQQAESVIQSTQGNTKINSYSFVIIGNTRASDLQAIIQYGHYPYQQIHN